MYFPSSLNRAETALGSGSVAFHVTLSDLRAGGSTGACAPAGTAKARVAIITATPPAIPRASPRIVEP